MGKWLSKAISHPLSAGIIAGTIGAVFGGLILFKLTTTGNIVWPAGIVDGFHSLLAWIVGIGGGLIAPVPVPRVLLYILIGITVVSVLCIVVWMMPRAQPRVNLRMRPVWPEMEPASASLVAPQTDLRLTRW